MTAAAGIPWRSCLGISENGAVVDAQGQQVEPNTNTCRNRPQALVREWKRDFSIESLSVAKIGKPYVI